MWTNFSQESFSLLNSSFRDPFLFWLSSKGLEDPEVPRWCWLVDHHPEDLGGEEMVDFASEEVSCCNQWRSQKLGIFHGLEAETLDSDKDRRGDHGDCWKLWNLWIIFKKFANGLIYSKTSQSASQLSHVFEVRKVVKQRWARFNWDAVAEGEGSSVEIDACFGKSSMYVEVKKNNKNFIKFKNHTQI